MRLNKIYIIIIALTLKQLLWLFFIPVWQFPDEQAHFAQLQNVAERNDWKNVFPISTSEEIYKSEDFLGTLRNQAGDNKYTYHPSYNIEYSSTNEGPYEDIIKALPVISRKKLIISEGTGYPPLYYIFGAWFYKLVYTSDLFTRVYTSRIVNIFFYLCLLIISYKTVKRISSKSTALHLATVMLIGLHPMFSFVSAGVNSDILFTLTFSSALYIGICLLAALRVKYIFLLAAVVYISFWVKPQAYLILFISIFPFVYHIFKMSRQMKLIILGSVTVVSLSLVLYFKETLIHKQFIPDIPSLGKLSFNINYFDHIKNTLMLSYRQTLPWYWGIYRWLSLGLPIYVYRVINFVTALSIVGLLLGTISAIWNKKMNINLIFVLFSMFIYIVGIYTYDLIFFLSRSFSFGLQGRYFFPLIVPQMYLLLLGVYVLGRLFSKAKLMVYMMILLMSVLQIFSFLYVTFSYYSSSSIGKYITFASQYKPSVIKGVGMEVILLCGVLSLGTSIYMCAKLMKKDEYS